MPAHRAAPRRRRLLQAALTGALAASLGGLLAGCGFRLRQAPNFSFQSIFLAMANNSSFGQELRRNLLGSGNVTVLTDVRQIEQADVIFDLQGELREKVVVAYNSAGQVREFQLRLRIRMRLRTLEGLELIPSVEIMQQRDISFNEASALSKEAEEQLLYRDMQTDLVQQTMRRLAAVQKP